MPEESEPLQIGGGFGGAPVGAVNPQVGQSGFEQGVQGDVERQLKPRFGQALRGLRANTASAGMKESGLGAFQEADLQQGLMDRLADAAGTASTRGAVLAEENRQRELERQFQRERREKQFEFAREQQKKAEARARNAAFSGAVGQGAGAVGSLLGDIMDQDVDAPASTSSGSSDDFGLSEIDLSAFDNIGNF